MVALLTENEHLLGGKGSLRLGSLLRGLAAEPAHVGCCKGGIGRGEGCRVSRMLQEEAATVMKEKKKA